MSVRGTSNIAIVGTAAAVGNALLHATSLRLRNQPMTPDKVLATLQEPD